MEIGGVVFEADMIPIGMTDFDAIMGMDWLVQHCALVDCCNKEVILRGPSGEKAIYR